MCAMCSSAPTPPRLCWTGQLTEQVLTARSCTCTAQRATSCVAARMGSGGTLSIIIKARRCDGPPDARDYSMRLWPDPDRIADVGLTSSEVLAAIRAQNLQITGGQIAEPPIADRALQPNIVFTGRLKDISQFEDIVVKAGSDGRTVRLRDVARVELGALSYATSSRILRKSAVAMVVTQRPGSNALATAKAISTAMAKLKESFPKGLDYNIGYNPTEFIAQSVHELIKTVYEAMALVVIVVLVFLQGWRPAIIPIIAIPV